MFERCVHAHYSVYSQQSEANNLHVAMVKVILADEKKDQVVLTYLKGDHMSDIGAQIYKII